MSKARRRRRHRAYVRWCNGLITSPAAPPTGYYVWTLFTAGRHKALTRRAGRVWRDVSRGRELAWIWAPRR